VIVVGADNQVQQVTPSARQRIGELGGIQWGALPMPCWPSNKLRDTRAVATRYDKREFVYKGTIDVATIRIWLPDPTLSDLRDTA